MLTTVASPRSSFAAPVNTQVLAGGDSRGSVGGKGADHLEGGTGPSILIGGTGGDKLDASTAGSILIAGSTSFDANIRALKSLLVEWSRTDEPIGQKYDHIYGNVAGGSNGSYLLNAATISNDNAVDDLDGDNADNLFFGRVAGSKKDKFKNVSAGSLVVNI